MKAFVFILLVTLALPGAGNDAANELLASYQTKDKNDEPIDELCDSLEDQDHETLSALVKALDRAWPRMRDHYLKALEADAVLSGGSSDNRRRVKELREEFLRIRQLGEAEMKPLLKSASMPAMEEIRGLLAPTTEDILDQLDPATIALRKSATRLAQFRDALLEADISGTPGESMKELDDAEAELSTEASDLPSDGLRMLKKNRKTAESKNVPEEEARGIEEANMWRMLVGLNALELDPKLCEASRDHSKDMAEKGFFAHQSPVSGKTTPWDRAKNFGTSASGENIYMGSSNPESANKGWFFSPGHHKNLFGAKHARIGLGRHGSHWTQMFGK